MPGAFWSLAPLRLGHALSICEQMITFVATFRPLVQYV